MKKMQKIPLQSEKTIKTATYASSYHIDGYNFIIDRKYEKTFEKLMTAYCKTTNPSYKRKRLILLLSISIASLITFKTNEEKIVDPLSKIIERTGKDIGIINYPNIRKLEINRNTYEISTNLAKKYEQKWNDPKLLATIEETVRQNQYDEYLKEYCSYFNFDSQKVITLAREATNDYSLSFERVINNKKYNLTDPEVACMIFVYELHIEREKSKIDFSKFKTDVGDLTLSNQIITTPHDNFETLILNNGYSYLEFISKICDLFSYEDKILPLALCYSEAGVEGSYSSRNRNNAFGMKKDNEHLIFPTLEGGIISCLGRIKNYYENYGYTIYNLDKLAKKYNSMPNEMEQWKINFKNHYYKIKKNYDYYFNKNTEEEIESENIQR